MTTNLSGLELRAAVAEKVMGLDTRTVFEDQLGCKEFQVWGGTAAHGFLCDKDGWYPCPAYELNPAAARAMEDEIEKRGLAAWYAKQLLCVVLGNGDAEAGWAAAATQLQRGLDAHHLRAIIYATPTQRCLAALAATQAPTGA